MLKVLTQFGRAGDHLPLSDPLLQLVDLPVELVEPVLLLQSALPLLHQVLQRHVQTIDLRLALADLLAVEREECVRGNIKTCYITSTPYSDRPSACRRVTKRIYKNAYWLTLASHFLITSSFYCGYNAEN